MIINTTKKLLIEAIISFEIMANELIIKLANEFELDLTQQNPFSKLIIRENNLWKGNLKDNWAYWFHGDACEFENTSSKQFVYVKVNRNGNYATIDIYYLYKFILTTDSLSFLASKIKSEKKFWEMFKQLEDEKIIINIEENEYFKSRILNHNLLKEK